MYLHGLQRWRPLEWLTGYLQLYSYKPKSVTAGLGCGLECSPSLSCDDGTAEVAYYVAIMALYKLT